MTRLQSLRLRGFRAFGNDEQTLDFTGPVSVLLGTNSQGKTSLAEAFEFLLTGTISRRALVSSTTEEFAGALRNAHIAAGVEVSVSLTLEGADGADHVIKRVLIEDFGMRSACRTELTLDNRPAAEADLVGLGIVLSQPPLAAPVLMQHTLGHLFSVKPQERSSYFKALLEITDLDELLITLGQVDGTLTVLEAPSLRRLRTCTSLPQLQGLAPLIADTSSVPDVAAVIAGTAAQLLIAAGEDSPTDPAACVRRLAEVLRERRSRTFRLDILQRRAANAWSPSREETWEALESFKEQLTSVDEETKRLTNLFSEVLRLPGIDDIAEPIDCPVCETPRAISPARVATLRAKLEANAQYQGMMTRAAEAVRHLDRVATAASSSIVPALPSFLDGPRDQREALGFSEIRLASLLGADATTLLQNLEAALEELRGARDALATATTRAREHLRPFTNDVRELSDISALRTDAEEVSRARHTATEALARYSASEQRLREALHAAVDVALNTQGWEDLAGLWDSVADIRQALAVEMVTRGVRRELATALQDIERAKEEVLTEKFGALSDDIVYWWNLLRPDGLTFFEGLRPRPGSKRTVDFKAGLAASLDRATPKLRDVVAVFSQSQLHCLGLAAFIARTAREASPFLVLDDPILSSDDDHRLFFTAQVVKELIDRGVQVFVLTQDPRTCKDLTERYSYLGIDVFRIALDDPARGAEVVKTSDELAEFLQRGSMFMRSGNDDLRKRAAGDFRVAAERMCKSVAVNGRRAAGDAAASLTDYDGKTLAPLIAAAIPYLTDPSEPGKLRAIGTALNPGTHDNPLVPSSGDLIQCYGELKAFKRTYCR